MITLSPKFVPHPPLEKGHSSDCPIIPPLGPVGRKTSRVVRRPSKHRIKEDLSLQTTANHMYVDSEQMLQPTPVPELQPNFTKLLGRSSPLVTSPDMSPAVAIRCQLDQGQCAATSPPAVPAHGSPCGCLQQQVCVDSKLNVVAYESTSTCILRVFQCC